MIFTHPDENNEFTATIENGENTEVYQCLVLGCENPTCTCEALTIQFSPATDTEETSSGALYSITFDLQKKRIGISDTEETSSKTAAFAKRLDSQLDGDDFQFLYSYYYGIKNEATLAARPETIEAEFDSASVETGMMYAYMEILPYSTQLTATLGKELFLFLDRYCLASRCDCTEATLSLFTKGRIVGKTKERCLIRVDYETKTWEMSENFSLKISVKAIQAAAEEQIEAFYETLKNRHLKLRAIYRHNQQTPPKAKPRIASKTVGRNEPCPCGSGKKYKKCCLRNPAI